MKENNGTDQPNDPDLEQLEELLTKYSKLLNRMKFYECAIIFILLYNMFLLYHLDNLYNQIEMLKTGMNVTEWVFLPFVP